MSKKLTIGDLSEIISHPKYTNVLTTNEKGEWVISPEYDKIVEDWKNTTIANTLGDYIKNLKPISK